jgi:hypothetical protein
MAAWSRLPQQFANSLLIVALPSPTAAAEAGDEGKRGVRVLLDPEQQTARRYNARWLPRAYALDEQGILTYVQAETTLDPHAPLQVEALWRAASPAASRHEPPPQRSRVREGSDEERR